MAVVRWLHISDLHLNRRGVESKQMRKQLPDFLKKLKVSCKYIFITGDLRYAPEGGFGENTVDYLIDIKEALGIDISNVFIVPGNHDVERDEKDRKDAICKVLNKGYYNSHEGIIRDPELIGIFSGKTDFTGVMDSFYKSIPERRRKYHNATEPHFLEITDDFNVIHLDSTLTYSGDCGGDILLCTEKLLDVLETCDSSKPKVVLSHYSFDFLSRDEQKSVEKLLRENGVGLWLSGHEHDLLIRVQRESFYDIQCGNINYEEGDIRSCVLFGEMDTTTKRGKIWGYEWDRDIGWKEIQVIDKKRRSNRYEIDLDQVLMTGAACEEARNESYAFEAYLPTDENIPGMSVLESNKARERLGAESKQIDANNDSEPKILWKDNNGSSFFLNKSECAVYQGLLYIDGGVAPYMKMTVRHSKYKYGVDQYEIENDTVRFDVKKIGDMYIFITFKYNLSRFADVDERLLHFRKIKDIQDANSLYVKVKDHEEYNLNLDIIKKVKAWKESVESTNYWIDKMERIASIEKHFGIKFSLPPKATEDDYLTIDVLSDSIDGLPNRTLSPIPMEYAGFTRSFELKEEVQIGEGERLLWLRLFGYDFKPVGQYMLPGRYVWRKKAKAWEAEKHKGGVPVRVEFEVSSLEEGCNTLDLKEVVLGDCEEDFCIDNVTEIDREGEEFLEQYTRLAHDVRMNYKLFCDYRSLLRLLTDEAGDCGEGNNEKFRNPTQSTVLINRITERIASAGSRLIEGMVDCAKYIGIGEQFTIEKYYADNIGFMWLICMQRYTEKGHFPISIRSGHKAEYNFKQIRKEAKAAGYNQVVEIVDMIMDTIGKNIEYITSWYNIIRNYCYTVAVMQRDYYNLIEPVFMNKVERLKDFIKMNPGIVHRGKHFDNHIVYLSKNDKRNLHLLSIDDDAVDVFNNYKNAAMKHLEYQRIGLKGEVEV